MPEQPLTTRVEADTFRRLKMEAVMSGQTIQELVEVALGLLLDEREDDRKRAAR